MAPEPVRPLVLIVDDDQDTRDMYSLFLDYSGMSVLTAVNVETAFALAVEHQPDIVITDFLLGAADNGAELCRRLHGDQRTAHIPAVLLTGSTRKADAEAALVAGCGDVRIKPYLPDALVSDIHTILARGHGRPLVG